MPSTYVDNYTLVDTINASATQGSYHSNQGQLGTTLTTDSYVPDGDTTPTIAAGLRDIPAGAILDRGYSQKALYELLLMIVVNWNNAMRSLDDSAGVDSTDYEEDCAIGNLASGDFAGNYSDACIAALLALGMTNTTGTPSLGMKINISPEGIGTPQLAVLCQAIASMFAACTAKLDGETDPGDGNYASTLDIDFTAKTGRIPPLATTVPFNIFHPDVNGYPNPCSKITTTGIHHEALVDFLNTVVTNMNALWVKLDADI